MTMLANALLLIVGAIWCMFGPSIGGRAVWWVLSVWNAVLLTLSVQKWLAS